MVNLSDLPFSDRDHATVREAIESPFGLIIATGPTGAGKTTTLYGMLQELNQPELKVATVEDPVEYTFPGMLQIQVNASSGVTYPRAMRGMLTPFGRLALPDERAGKLRMNKATNRSYRRTFFGGGPIAGLEAYAGYFVPFYLESGARAQWAVDDPIVDILNAWQDFENGQAGIEALCKTTVGQPAPMSRMFALGTF